MRNLNNKFLLYIYLLIKKQLIMFNAFIAVIIIFITRTRKVKKNLI